MQAWGDAPGHVCSPWGPQCGQTRPPGTVPLRRRPLRPALRPSSALSATTADKPLQQLKLDLQQSLQALGRTKSILPGSLEAKQRVDVLIQQMEQSNPCPKPILGSVAGGRAHLQNAGITGSGEPSSTGLNGGSSGSSSSSNGRGVGGSVSAVDGRLLGNWDLVFTSNGTVVTRTSFAQTLINASTNLPGVGLNDIKQTLAVNEAGSILTSNVAVFGLGPFGAWRVGIQGTWSDLGDGQTVQVVFDKVQVGLNSWIGLQMPEWLPQVTLATPSSGASRSGAEWRTTYLDEDFRVGRGKSGNAFLFQRSQSKQ